jgi:hypothetical protein
MFVAVSLPMIQGVSATGISPWSFISKVQPSRTPQTAPTPQVQNEQPPPAERVELAAPSGDEATLTREFNLFDLATRQFSRILPVIETATVPVE